MSNRKYTIGIIGNGVVGQAVASFFYDAKIYDKFKTRDPLAEVLAQDIIFICVPTPYNNGFDRSVLDDVFNNFNNLSDKIVVIKSTSLPGTADFYQAKFPQLKILFNPEFLSEKTAIQDFLKPDKQIVGYTNESQPIAELVLSLLPAAPYKKIMPAAAAELVKYAVNSFYATKVIFGNWLYDLSQSLGVDYNQLKEAFVADQRIFDSHFDVWHGGYRGFGGKCLPKDLKSIKDFTAARGMDAALLEVVDTLNQKYSEHS